MGRDIIAIDQNTNYAEFASLHDSVDECLIAGSIAKSLKILNTRLQTIMICGRFDPMDSILVDYYSSPLQILTSLICSSVDSSTGQSLSEYFSKFLEEFNLKDSNSSFLEQVIAIDIRISSPGVTGLDTVLRSNSELVNTMYNLLKDNFVVSPFKTYEGSFRSWSVECGLPIDLDIQNKLFISKVTWRNSRILSPVDVVLGSRFCNGLFPIKKSKLDDTTLTTEVVNKCFEKLKEHKDDQFLYQQFLYDRRNCNSIAYSCYLLKSVGAVLEGVLVNV